MKLHYYAETNSLYVELRNLPCIESREVSDGLIIDLAADGFVVGLDIEGASARPTHAGDSGLPVGITSIA